MSGLTPLPTSRPASPASPQGAGPGRGRRIAARAAKLVGLAAGLALLALMIDKAGPLRLLAHLRSLGWWSLAVLAVSSTWFMLNSWGWRFTFPPRRPGFGRLLRVHLISEAVSNITPFLALGGEPLKIVLLGREVGTGAALASVVNDNVVHVITAVLFMLAGLGFGLLSFRLEPALLGGLGGALVLFTLATLLLVQRGRQGLLAPLARLALRLRLPLPRSSKAVLLERAAAVDAQIGEFLARRQRDFLGCLTGHLAGRLMGAVEAWVILWALGTPVSLGTAIFLIAVMHVLVNLVFSIIPSQLGVQEGAAYLLFAAIGLDPSAAVALALIRRIRGFFWIGVGLVLLGISRAAKPHPAPPAAAAPAR